MPITYRPLEASDRDFCVCVHHLAMRRYVEPLWGWDEPRQDRLALAEIADRHALHEIVLLDATPIGYLSHQDLSDVIFLDTLFLHPDHQGRGYGSAIMARLIARAGARQADRAHRPDDECGCTQLLWTAGVRCGREDAGARSPAVRRLLGDRSIADVAEYRRRTRRAGPQDAPHMRFIILCNKFHAAPANAAGRN